MIMKREKIEAGKKDGEDGEIRDLLILFADIRHFSSITQQVELLYSRDFLNDFYGQFVQVIGSQHGEVNKFLGDGALAVFASTENGPPPFDAAALAAIELYDHFIKLSKSWKLVQECFGTADLGVGVSFGTVFWGKLGAMEHCECTAVGHAVNVAQRLAADCDIGGVFCSAPVQRALQDKRVCTDYFGKIDLRGIEGREEVYRLFFAQKKQGQESPSTGS